MSLSKRVRPGVEAAPWVVQEIAALEAKVRELEAERDAHHSNYKFMQRCAEENNAKLTASRQQVERLVEALIYVMEDEPTGIPRASSACRRVVKEALAAVGKVT